jgi:hypothetical protein
MGDRQNPTTPFTCVTCEIAITAPATFHAGLPFCCAGCFAGGPCTCSYDDAPSDQRVRHCLDIEGVVGSRSITKRPEVIAKTPR